MRRFGYEETLELLKKYNQTHLLNHYSSLSDDEKQELLSQINLIDFNMMKDLYTLSISNASNVNDTDKIEPISYVDSAEYKDNEHYLNLGKKVLEKNGLAVVTMAGGQGTRLGHSGPKGTYILDVDGGKSLFQLLCETLKRANKKYNTEVPWYIMTSNANNKDTINFFKANNYFGYNKDNIKFFIQGELPMLLEDGKVILETKGKIKFAADGHGGVFSSLNNSGLLQDMKARGVKWVFIGGIDNCLLNMVDPVFIGICEEKNYAGASRTIAKNSPREKVGAFCIKNGHPAVIEYTEITEKMANLKDERGEYVYGQSHILENLFSLEFLEILKDEKLPYHSAYKASNYIDENGNEVLADKPNAFKYEAFLFDAFEKMDDVLLYKVKREEEFAPLKNKEGNDSPATAKLLYDNLYNKILNK